MLNPLTHVQKRDGNLVEFDQSRIENAALKALEQASEGGREEAKMIAKTVTKNLKALIRKNKFNNNIPTVEQIQDIVEVELMREGFAKAAKAFILYRSERAKIRKTTRPVPDSIKKLVTDSSKYFRSSYSEFIFYQMYSRWLPELERRETWTETVRRYIDFMRESLGKKLTNEEYNELEQGILQQDVCPSMRLLWSSGEAARNSNVWAYNCSYIAPSCFQDLGEIMYILMCGAGLGFSVEAEAVQRFPQIKKQTGKKLPIHIVEDSKEGWAEAFVLGMKTWAEGEDINFDYSRIRPAGARLKTAGGRASGPQPLIDLMRFARNKVLARQNRRLTNVDLHDIICQIGLIVVAGGVRRSALISLSDLDDIEMRDAKKGQFYVTEGQRVMANNSAVYNEKPSAEEFLDEWTALVKSKSGERGIFNRGSLSTQLPARRWEKLKNEKLVGLNPCGEIYLRSKQFCNLTSIVIRPEDSLEDLKRKMKLATILGTYQSTLTNFGYLSKGWKDNCEEERLLGVSLTGYYDNQIIRDDKVLDTLREEGIKINQEYAKRLSINQSTAITCVKPHGNSGQLLGVGSGMHPWFAPYFIRRVRISHTDPLLQFAREQGVPCLPEVGQAVESATTFVLEFPVKAPDKAIFKEDVTALELLTEWKRLKQHFVEHNPSATIYVGPNEWLEVANFVYQNWDWVGGLSFLPRSDHVYQLAPYEAIDQTEYERRKAEIGQLDFSKLMQYEMGDSTTGSKEFACVSGACEL